MGRIPHLIKSTMRLSTTILALSSISKSSAFLVQPVRSFLSSSVVLHMNESKKTGTVKWFNAERGYGFIVPDDGSKDIFVHQTAIQKEGFRSLADGEKVEYDIETDSSDGRIKASIVTGPGGADVQGAAFNDYY